MFDCEGLKGGIVHMMKFTYTTRTHAGVNVKYLKNELNNGDHLLVFSPIEEIL